MDYRIEKIRDFAHWRHRALQAIHANVRPDRLHWEGLASCMPSLPLAGLGRNDMAGCQASGVDLDEDVAEAHLVISKAFRDTLREAASFRTPDRWSVLYTALWRWAQGQKDVASPADDLGSRLHHMAKAVRRDRHDFIAYLRFQEQDVPAPAPRFVAWYEPDHDTLPWAAEHFADRMGASAFLIATPDCAASWDGHALSFREVPPGTIARPPSLISTDGGKQDAASTALWLIYYRSIFNPARLNERALAQHLPVRRWRGLPEAVLIPGLVGAARSGAQRVGQAAAVGMRDGRAIHVTSVRSNARRSTPAQLDETLHEVEHEVAHEVEHEPSHDHGHQHNRDARRTTRHEADSLDQCRRCTLWKDATAAVAGEGPVTARFMVVGEQPGDHEDLMGRVFVGPAGQVLNEALTRAGLARDEIYVTNAVKHFKWEPRGKRRIHKTPQQHEIVACRHWLEAEIARVAPAVIVTLGATALSSVLETRVTLSRYLNEPMRHDDRWVVPTYHPAYALRQADTAARDRAIDAMVTGLTRARALIELPEFR